MAMLSKGIVGGDMAWPLVIVGILLGLAMIMIEVKSVMLSPSHVSAAGHNFCHFHRRRDSLATDNLREPSRLERCAESAGRKRRRPDGLRSDRRRSAVRPAHRGLVGLARRNPIQVDSAILAGARRASRVGHRHDPSPASERRRPEDPAPPTAIM